MATLSVTLDVSRMRSSVRGMRRQVNAAASRAINRAIDTARVTAGREVSKATKIKVRDVRARMSVRGSNPANLVATLTAHPYSPNLSRFRATENKTGVAATAWEGRKTYRHAFKLPSGKVVTRTTKERTPLKGLRGPSVPRTFVRDEIMDAMEKAARARFNAEFQRELTRRLGR